MEEEMEAFKKVVAVALGKLQPIIQATDSIPNGVEANSR